MGAEQVMHRILSSRARRPRSHFKSCMNTAWSALGLTQQHRLPALACKVPAPAEKGWLAPCRAVCTRSSGFSLIRRLITTHSGEAVLKKQL